MSAPSSTKQTHHIVSAMKSRRQHTTADSDSADDSDEWSDSASDNSDKDTGEDSSSGPLTSGPSWEMSNALGQVTAAGHIDTAISTDKQVVSTEIEKIKSSPDTKIAPDTKGEPSGVPNLATEAAPGSGVTAGSCMFVTLLDGQTLQVGKVQLANISCLLI